MIKLRVSIKNDIDALYHEIPEPFKRLHRDQIDELLLRIDEVWLEFHIRDEDHLPELADSPITEDGSDA